MFRIGSAHVVSAVFTWCVLTGLLAGSIAGTTFVVTGLWVVGVYVDPHSSVMGGVLTFFLRMLFTVLAILATTTATFVIVVTAICLDAMRRPLRVHVAFVPVIVAVTSLPLIAAAAWVIGATFLRVMEWAGVGSFVLTAIFCLYWVPLMCSSSALHLAEGVAGLVIRVIKRPSL